MLGILYRPQKTTAHTELATFLIGSSWDLIMVNSNGKLVLSSGVSRPLFGYIKETIVAGIREMKNSSLFYSG